MERGPVFHQVAGSWEMGGEGGGGGESGGVVGGGRRGARRGWGRGWVGGGGVAKENARQEEWVAGLGGVEGWGEVGTGRGREGGERGGARGGVGGQVEGDVVLREGGG